MAIYVDLLPVEEQAITLANFFNNLQIAKDGGKSDENEKQFAGYQDLIAKRDLKQLLLQFVQQHELVFSQGEEKDIETCWSTICSLARNIKQEDVRDVVLAIIQVVSSNTASATLLRLRILNNLYNYLPANSTAKYDILLAILNYALATQNSAVIKPFYGRIGEWVNQWELNNAQKRTIYDLLFKLSELTSPGSRAGYELLLKSLLTFEDGENLQDGLGAAKEAAIRAIKLADVHQCDDLLEMKAIKQLQSNAETAPLFELLSLFATDKLEAFEQFVASNPQFLASVGLSQDDCSTKIRLLSLASLASAHSELSYAVIAQTLRVGENDVENWVIQAISAELLDAKLDQLTKTVSIHRCTQRVFTGVQWSLLSQKLNGWQKNIQNILQVLQSSHGRRSA